MRRALVLALLAMAAVAGAQEVGLLPIDRSDRAALDRALDRLVQGRTAADRWARLESHFLKGADGRTYVPFTVTLDGRGERFADAAVSFRVAVREIMNTRFGTAAYRVVQRNAFGVRMQPTPAGGRFVRSALMLRPGQYEVFIAIRERGETARPESAGLTALLTVPDFTKKGLRLSSVIVADRLEPLGEAVEAGAARPYVLGTSEIVPVSDTEFTRDETLTVAFQVYNAATFVDGKPDVQVDYRVYREGENRPIGATAPQTFDVDSLPEEFSAAAGHQLTPVQALPLAQFEPGEYRLEIEVRDFLGDARAATEVPFTITPGRNGRVSPSEAHASTHRVPCDPALLLRIRPGTRSPAAPRRPRRRAPAARPRHAGARCAR